MKSSTLFLAFLFSVAISFQIDNTFTKVADTTCPTNCATCDSDNKCTQCKDTFQLVNQACQCPDNTTEISSVCVSCAISNCNKCSSYNFCSQCSTSLVVNSQGNACVTCDNSNCMLCSSSNTCKTCMPGYTLSTGGSCFNCSDFTGCLSCSADNVCQQCIDNYDLVDNKCVLCEQPCTACSAPNVCTSCNFHYSITPDINGICFTCNISNCHSCSSEDVCTQCQNLYTLTTDNACTLLCTGTSFCSSCGTDGVCSACVSGWALSSTSTCQKCTGAPECAACSTSNLSSCTACLSGFYLSSGSCVACPYENCDTCNSTVCLTLKAATNQISYNNNPSSTLYAVFCNQECASCSVNNPEFCYKCYNGYALSNGNCYPCTSPCAGCTVDAPSVCLQCFENSFISNGTCKTCNTSSSCLTCSSTNTTLCTSCNYGYSVTEDGVCENNCQQNCLLCTSADNGTTTCTHCKSGYTIGTVGDCVPCYPNCRVCSSVNPALCVDCGPGFYLDSSYACNSCGEWCLTCTSGGCLSCVGGYYVNSTNQCAPDCSFPCASCNASNITQCYSCMGGYVLDSDNNVCNNSASNCEDDICTLCPLGYTLNGISCTRCSRNCSRCDVTNTSKCTSCIYGQYLSNNSCLTCAVGCLVCTNSEICLLCSTGYALELSGVGFNPHVCQRCIYPCSTCLSDANTCTSCAEGFYIHGWRCLATFNFGLQIRLKSNLTNFYENYYTFLENVAATMQTNNIDIVSVYDIASNRINASFDNVEVYLNISALADPGTSNAEVVQKNVQTYFQQASTLGNMTVLNYDLQTNNGQISTQANLGLILGLTIPLGLLLIAGVAYFICSSTSDSDGNPLPYTQINSQDTRRVTYELKENL